VGKNSRSINLCLALVHVGPCCLSFLPGLLCYAYNKVIAIELFRIHCRYSFWYSMRKWDVRLFYICELFILVQPITKNFLPTKFFLICGIAIYNLMKALQKWVCQLPYKVLCALLSPSLVYMRNWSKKASWQWDISRQTYTKTCGFSCRKTGAHGHSTVCLCIVRLSCCGCMHHKAKHTLLNLVILSLMACVTVWLKFWCTHTSFIKIYRLRVYVVGRTTSTSVLMMGEYPTHACIDILCTIHVL